MENMNLRSMRSRSGLVPRTNSPKKAHHHLKETQSYTTVRGETSNSDAPADLSNQASVVEKGRLTAGFWGPISTEAGLESLKATTRRNLDSFAIYNAMMYRIEKTLAKQIDMNFLAVDTGIRNASYCFVEMALTVLGQQRLSDKVIHSSFDRWNQTNIHANRLAEEVCRHLILKSRVIEITNSDKTKSNLVQLGSTAELKAHVSMSSNASEDDSTLKQELVWCWLGNV